MLGAFVEVLKAEIYNPAGCYYRQPVVCVEVGKQVETSPGGSFLLQCKTNNPDDGTRISTSHFKFVDKKLVFRELNTPT